jgi:hypothetical protein
MRRMIPSLGAAAAFLAISVFAAPVALAAPQKGDAALPGPAGPPVVGNKGNHPGTVMPMLASKDCVSGGPTTADAQLASQLSGQFNTPRMGNSINAGQVSCARVIVNTVHSDQLAERAALLAVMTAMTESTLHDYTESADLDSLGLYQQRPSQGWGTTSQVTDPVYSTNSFLNVMQSMYPNNSWMSGDPGAICQAVQRSAYPDAYDAEEPAAQVVVQALWSTSARHSSVGSSADGMYVAYADPSGNVVHDWRTSDGVWHGPYGLGGTARADSPIVSSADGFYVTFIDPSGNVVHDWRTSDGVWHGPYALGGTARAGSGLAVSDDGMYVAFADPSGNVVHDWKDATGWNGPYALGGTARADSPIASSSDGFYISFIDPSGNVVHDWRTSDGVWHGPYGLGGSARAGSGLASSSDGFYVAFVDPSGNVVHDWKDATGWNGPYALGGTARADSPITSSSDGFYISFIDPSGNVVHDWRTSDGVWHGPYNLGGTARAGSGLASSSDGFYVAFVDPSGNVVHDWKDATGWNGPYALGGTSR